MRDVLPRSRELRSSGNRIPAAIGYQQQSDINSKAGGVLLAGLLLASPTTDPPQIRPPARVC